MALNIISDHPMTIYNQIGAMINVVLSNQQFDVLTGNGLQSGRNPLLTQDMNQIQSNVVNPKNKMKLTVACRKLIASVLIAQLIIPSPAFSTIQVDTRGPSGTQATLDQAQNGVQVVNISAPNQGLSHNRFTQYNVSERGVILNNSLAIGRSQLGGVLYGNPQFAAQKKAAQSILFEVTGAGMSQLRGMQEIFGNQASFTLANPNGIAINGGGFINTPRATLTTGRPVINNGQLTGLAIHQGGIEISGAGLDGSRVDYVDVIANHVSVKGPVQANEQLQVVAGQQTYDYQQRQAGRGTGTGTGYLDSSALGGMYAGRIQLVTTQKGVGVNTQGKIATLTGELEITSQGKIIAKSIASKTSTRLTATNDDITLGDSYANEQIGIQSGGDVQVSKVTAGGQIVIKGDRITKADDVIASGGIELEGRKEITTKRIISGERISLTTSGEYRGEKAMAADRFNAVVGQMDGGIIESGSDIDITAEGTIRATTIINDGKTQVRGGDISYEQLDSKGAVTVTARNTIEQTNDRGDGYTYSGESVTMTGSDITYSNAQSNGDIQIKGSGHIRGKKTIGNGQVTVYGKAIDIDTAKAGGKLSVESLTQVTSRELMYSQEEIDIKARGGIAFKTLKSGGEIRINHDRGSSLGYVSGQTVNGGTLVANKAITITGDQIVFSEIQSGGKVTGYGKDITYDRVSSEGDSELKAARITQTDKLDSEGDVLFEASDRLTINGSKLESSGAITIQNTGTVVAKQTIGFNGTDAFIDANKVSMGGQVGIELRDATIKTAGDLTINAPNLTIDNARLNASLLTITAPNQLALKGAKLYGSNAMALDTQIVNPYTLTAGNELKSDGQLRLGFNGSLINYGTITGVKGLHITVRDITNWSIMQSLANMSLNTTVGGIENQANARIESAGLLTMTTAGRITNQGQITAIGKTVLSSQDVVNLGQIASLGALEIETNGDMTNKGLLFSGGDMTFRTNGNWSNTDSNVYAMGGLTIGNKTGGRAGSFRNSYGNVESDGDMLIKAGSIINEIKEKPVVSETYTVIDVYQFEGVPYKKDSYRYVYRFETGHGYGFTFTGNDRWYPHEGVRRKIWRQTITKGAQPSRLLAGRDMRIDTGSLINDASWIYAKGNMHIDATSVDNRTYAATYKETHEGINDRIHGYWYKGGLGDDPFRNDFWHLYQWSDNVIDDAEDQSNPADPYSNHYRPYDYVGGEKGFNNWIILPYGLPSKHVFTTVLDEAQARIQSRGNLTGTITTHVNNTTITGQKEITNTVAKQALKDRIEKGINPLNRFELPNHSRGLFKVNEIKPDPIVTHKRAETTSRQRAYRLIKGHVVGQVNPKPPRIEYVVETNARFINQTDFYGSKYLVERLGVSGDKIRLLGDPFYETRLIRDTIREQVGRDYLDSTISSDKEQMKALYDGAIKAQADLQLSVGVTLTKEQINQLNRDIIWLEEEWVDGVAVLVPKLYLSKLTRRDVDLKAGSIIKAKTIDLTVAKGQIVNEGAIESTGKLKLTTQDDITNRQGTIESDGDVTITSKQGQLVNTSGSVISGDRVEVDVNGDVINRGSTVQSKGDMVVVSRTGSIKNEIEVISRLTQQQMAVDVPVESRYEGLLAGRVVQSGKTQLRIGMNGQAYANGTLDIVRSEQALGRGSSMTAGNAMSMQAKGDINTIGSRLQSGTDMQVIAGGSVRIESGRAERTETYTTTVLNETKSQVTRLNTDGVVQSSVQSGGRLLVGAQGDISIKGSDVSAKKEMQLVGQTGVMIQNEQRIRDTGDNRANYRKEIIKSRVSAGEGIQVQSQSGDVSVVASQVNGGGAVTMVGRNIVVGSDAEEINHTAYYKQGRRKTWVTSQKKRVEGSEITGQSVKLLTEGTIGVVASAIKGDEAVVLSGTKGVVMTDAQSRDYEHVKTVKKRRWFGKKKDTYINESIRSEGSSIETNGVVAIQSDGDVTLKSVKVNSGLATQIAGGGDVSILAGQDARLSQHIKKRSGLVSRQTKDQGQYKVSNKESEIGSKGDVSIKAGGALMVAGSDVKAGRHVNVNAKGNVYVASAEELERNWMNKTNDIMGLYKTEHERIQLQTKQQSASVKAEDQVQVVSGKSLAIRGSMIESGGNARLSAADDLIIESALETDYDMERKKKMQFGGVSFSLSRSSGSMSYSMVGSEDKREQTTVKQKGSEVKVGGKLETYSGHDTVVAGSDIVANQDIDMKADGDLSVRSTEEMQEIIERNQNIKNTISVVVGNSWVETAYSVDDTRKAIEQIDEIEGDTQTARTAKAVQTAMVAAQTAKLVNDVANSAASAATFGFYVGGQNTTEVNESNSKTKVTSQRGSQIVSREGDVKLEAKKTLSVQGSDVMANNGDVILGGKDVSITSSEERFTQGTGTMHHSMTVTLGTNGIHAPTFTRAESETKTTQVTHRNSQIQAANGTVKIKSSNDTLVEGASIKGKNVDMTEIEGDLTVASKQDRMEYESNSQSVSVGQNMGFSVMHEKKSKTWTTNQTTIEGTDGVWVKANKLTMKGAVIANVDKHGKDKGNVNIDVKSYEAQKLNDVETHEYEAYSLGVSTRSTDKAGGTAAGSNQEVSGTATVEAGFQKARTEADANVVVTNGSFKIGGKESTKEQLGVTKQSVAEAHVITKKTNTGLLEGKATVKSSYITGAKREVYNKETGQMETVRTNGLQEIGRDLSAIPGLVYTYEDGLGGNTKKAIGRVVTAAGDLGITVGNMVTGETGIVDGVRMITTVAAGKVRDQKEQEQLNEQHANQINNMITDETTVSDVQQVASNQVENTTEILGGSNTNKDGAKRQTVVYNDGGGTMATPEGDIIDKTTQAFGLTDTNNKNIGINLNDSRLQDGSHVQNVTTHEAAHRAGYGEGSATQLGDIAAEVWANGNKKHNRSTGSGATYQSYQNQENWMNRQINDPEQQSVLNFGNQTMWQVKEGETLLWPVVAAASGAAAAVTVFGLKVNNLYNSDAAKEEMELKSRLFEQGIVDERTIELYRRHPKNLLKVNSGLVKAGAETQVEVIRGVIEPTKMLKRQGLGIVKEIKTLIENQSEGDNNEN